jgi:hypothetical protein
MGVKIIILFFIFAFSLPNGTFAHPGDTDAFGGHVCRTNCEEWGLNYGEYHYHDDSAPSNSQSDYDNGYEKGYDLAYSYTSQCEEEYDWWWEGPQSFGDGYEDGVKAGHDDGLAVCGENQTDLSDTLDVFLDDYTSKNQEDVTLSKESENEEVIVDNNKEYSEEKKEEKPYDYSSAIAIGGVLGAISIGYLIKKRKKAPLE